MSLSSPCTIDLPTRRATRKLAERLAQLAQLGDLIVLSGPLGAGKTFLVRALARRLGLARDERVTSPTFALVQELPTEPSLLHADLYRIQHPEQVFELGLDEARAAALLVVEWGEPHIEALGGDALVIELTRSPRQARVRASGPRSSELLAQLVARLPLPPPRWRATPAEAR